jgi:hypothetical protein
MQDEMQNNKQNNKQNNSNSSNAKPTVKPTTKANPSTTKASANPTTTKVNSKFKDIEYYDDDDDDEDFDNDSDEDEDTIEGFNGSQIIEGRYLKNILLALLISFIGYIIVILATKNVIPIAEYAPHMKKFKNLIYIGIFFMITYICLEVF